MSIGLEMRSVEGRAVGLKVVGVGPSRRSDDESDEHLAFSVAWEPERLLRDPW